MLLLDTPEYYFSARLRMTVLPFTQVLFEMDEGTRPTARRRDSTACSPQSSKHENSKMMLEPGGDVHRCVQLTSPHDYVCRRRP